MEKRAKTLDELDLEKRVENYLKRINSPKRKYRRTGEVTEIFTGMPEETPLVKVEEFVAKKGYDDVEIYETKIHDNGNMTFIFLSDYAEYGFEVGFNLRNGITFLRKATQGGIEDSTEYFNR